MKSQAPRTKADSKPSQQELPITVSYDAAREHILEILSDQIAQHDSWAAEHGLRVETGISQFRWSSEARRFSCTMPDEDEVMELASAESASDECKSAGSKSAGSESAGSESAGSESAGSESAGSESAGSESAESESAESESAEIESSEEIEVRVEVDLPFAIDDPLHIGCSCPSKKTRCGHTWAALTRFVDLAHEHENHPLFKEVFQLESLPAWTKTLDVFDDFLERQPNAEEPVPQTRLVWRVKLSPPPIGVELAAWEQKISSQTGEWTRGRQVSWERLRETPELWTCEADRKAAAAIREQLETYSSGYEPMWAWQIDVFGALKALDRHPQVFRWDAPDTPDRPVRIEKVDLSLVITLSGEDLVIDAALGGLPLRDFRRDQLHDDEDARGLVGWRDADGENPHRLLVSQAHPSVLQFVRTLDGKPRVVPQQGQAELLRRLNRLETLLPIQLPPELIGETIPSDRRLFLRLAPLNPSGIAAQIRVRPAPEGYYCIPGEGALRLTGIERGQRVSVERNIDEERTLARDLAEVVGLAEYGEERLFQWRVLEDDEALDLVLAGQYCDDEGLAVVEWPAGGQRQVVAPIAPASLRIEVEDRRDWFRLKANLETDSWRLSLLDLLIAMRQGKRYVRLGDTDAWAEIAESFRERLKAFDDIAHVNRNQLEIDATGIPILHELATDTGAVKASRRFERLTRRLEQSADFHPDPPEDLEATLRDYQLEGYRWMARLAYWGVGGCLADDMGLGKTVQTLTIMLARRDEGPTLVVAPTSLGFNWVREAERFTPTLNFILFREVDRQATVKKLRKGDVVVISYGLLVREAELLRQVKWGTLVMDEAQAVKNSQSKTAQAVRKIEAHWRLALTGTPIENHLGELWSLFRVVSPGLFGSWTRFRDRFAGPIEKEGDTERQQALSRLVRPFVLRRTKSEVLHELPARTEVDLHAEFSAKERDLYEDVRLKTLVQLAQVDNDDAGQRFQVLAALTRLRQLACHPALVEDEWVGNSAKLDLLLELVEDLRDGEHRALIFSQFTGHLGLIRKALEEKGFNCQYLDGQTPVKERGRKVDAFQAGEGDVFLISLMAGGTGLNLTAADYVIHMDPWWNPAVEDQATDRAHRMGQKRPVTVYRLVTRGTIEEEILSLHADKRDLVAGVLRGTDQAGRLSTAELVGLIRTSGSSDDES